MAYSYVKRSGDGITTSFTFSFTGQDEGYIREENIVVLVDGASVPFVLTSANILETDTAPPLDSEVLIRRVMPKQTPYADFQRGNNFGQDVLNNSFLQLLYVVHELLDGWFPEGFTVRQVVTFLEDLLVDSNLHVNGDLTTNGSDSDNPDSVVTFDEGDNRYINEHGDTMRGPLHVNEPQSSTEPARKGQLDEVVSNYQSADANIQDQLTGDAPLEASAFSPISWHDQEVDNSVTIPANKNAWSFGPTLSIANGQTVTISDGSFWTIANGEGDNLTISYDGGTL